MREQEGGSNREESEKLSDTLARLPRKAPFKLACNNGRMPAFLTDRRSTPGGEVSTIIHLAGYCRKQDETVVSFSREQPFFSAQDAVDYLVAGLLTYYVLWSLFFSPPRPNQPSARCFLVTCAIGRISLENLKKVANEFGENRSGEERQRDQEPLRPILTIILTMYQPYTTQL